MWALMLKEISGFLNSVTGYLVMVIYLAVNGIVLWLYPGIFNIIDGAYASIDNLFFISPWVFLFLVPAVTMRMMADEKRTGTIELLLTRPLTDLQIVLAKFLAALLLVLMAILPTFIYYFSVHQLGNPVGNIDSGGSFGSYIGLLFLAGGYVSIGLFSSSITNNQIVAFLIALILCLLVYIGFDQLANLDFIGNADLFVLELGMNEHYNSMSRGVLDSRDILYFLSVICLFTLATNLVLQSRKW